LETINRLAIIIKDLRRSILWLCLSIVLTTAAVYTVSPKLLALAQDHLDQDLAFFTVTGPFLSLVKLSLAMALFFLMPLIVFFLWRALARPFQLGRASVFWFVFFTCALFYAGAAFCYFITLPYGINFLLGFQSEQLRPVISITRFVTFVTVFILAFGLIFDLPIFMVFLARTGILPRSVFAKNRRYAVLAISIVAALLTPTPDVVNMMLMGIPLYLLYEAGIVVLKLLKIE
jgi:sec-independent protein translocase protein TatC